MRVYVDHAATSPLRESARDAWLAAQRQVGNASSVHEAGRTARRLIEDARDLTASLLGCDSVEVVFTSGGTESINLALKGLWWSRADRDAIVLPDGEHHATLEAVGWLATQGAAVRPVPLDGEGRIQPDDFANELEGAALATAIAANNEIGTINDVAALAARARQAGVPLHVDAVAALGTVPIRFSDWRGSAAGNEGLVAVSLSGHKIGAPIGSGVLVAARAARLTPLLHGGAHQRGLRAGTEDAAGAAAFAAALQEAEGERDEYVERVAVLRDRLRRGISQAVPGAEFLGPRADRLPTNLHVLFPDALGETLLFLLDQSGVSASTGSACQAGVTEPSHVVRAIGRDERAARSVLRFTLGPETTSEDIDSVIAAVGPAYRRGRAASVRS